MKRVLVTARLVDAYCARLNDGLAAVAVVLALVTGLTFFGQELPRLLQLLAPTIDPETGISAAES